MYINITRFGYIQWHTALQTTVGLHQQNYRGQSVVKILNGGVKSLNYPTPPGSKFPISWEGWRCELGGFNPPNPPVKSNPANALRNCVMSTSSNGGTNLIAPDKQKPSFGIESVTTGRF